MCRILTASLFLPVMFLSAASAGTGDNVANKRIGGKLPESERCRGEHGKTSDLAITHDRAGTYYDQRARVLWMTVLFWFRSLFVLIKRTRLVAAFDGAADRLRLVRNAVILFGLYGAGRIVYLLIWDPSLTRNSPLAKLIERIAG